MALSFKRLPKDNNRNGWLINLPTYTPRPKIQGDQVADWVVVGAGYAGLSFARRLAMLKPELNIILLEAGIVGDNASGRNSGFVIDLPHNIGSSTAELQKAVYYRRLLKAGIRLLEQQVSSQRIACDWRQQGKYHATANLHQLHMLEEYADELQLINEPCKLIEREELAALLGTDFYQRALYTPNTILLNPAALTQGLAAALPENVALHELTPALEIIPGKWVEIITPSGRIRANKLMLATNGAAAQLKGFRTQLTSFATFASLSAPLTDTQREHLGDIPSWGLTPTNAVAGATLRYTPDHRFLVRQHVKFSPSMYTGGSLSERIGKLHQLLFMRRYPKLFGMRWENTWSGLITVTRHGSPSWGRMSDNIYASLGCNGAGISKQTIAGSLLADMAAGEENPLIGDMLALGRPGWLPPRPILDIGAQGYLLKERWLGRKDK